jgi:hypothetical protein
MVVVGEGRLERQLSALVIRYLRQDTAPELPSHPHVYRMPSGETLGRSASLAPIFGYIENCIQHQQVPHTGIAGLSLQITVDPLILGFGVTVR